ncbi:MAG: Decaprenyl-phosphate phosphoribosyltransferase [Promethearchaeota archaeon]|nr:MAG: Decaprenyl-phosphate phosphoribosyltransferase [Candidatus Lokiarchaeota archaeon]
MFNQIRNIIHLIRVRQYYKNVLIFVGLFFSVNLFTFSYWYLLIIGFILLCLTSSINYIVNDILDIESDKKHPEKLKKKPLASGELSISFAIGLLVLIILTIVICLIFIVPNITFAILLLLIIITGQLYNHVFKNFAFIDILTLSTGYLWRALAGCVLINQYISAWLFLSIFEVALFLVIAKRKGDLMILGNKEDAIKHKKVYNQYSIKLLDQFHVITAGSIFMTYSLYLIFKFDLFSPDQFNPNEYLTILTIPILLFVLMRYMYLTSAEPEIARNTEKAITDTQILIAGLILGAVLFYSFYFSQIIDIINLILNFNL